MKHTRGLQSNVQDDTHPDGRLPAAATATFRVEVFLVIAFPTLVTLAGRRRFINGCLSAACSGPHGCSEGERRLGHGRRWRASLAEVGGGHTGTLDAFAVAVAYERAAAGLGSCATCSVSRARDGIKNRPLAGQMLLSVTKG